MFLLKVFLFLAGVSAQCACRLQGQVVTDGAVCNRHIGISPCAPASSSSTGFVSCCHAGDICGEDGFCHFRVTITGTSGYYMGGCTDPTFIDRSCPRQCTDLHSQDVVYNSTSGLWSCCWDNDTGAPDCSDPTKETFLAPSPEALFAGAFASVTARSSFPVDNQTPSSSSSSPTQPSTSNSASTTSTSTSSPISILTPTSTSAQRSDVSSNSFQTSRSSTSNTSTGEIISTNNGTSSTAGPTFTSTSSEPISTQTPTAHVSTDMSTGAKAGIGVGVSVVVISAVAVLLFFLWRRLRHNYPIAVQLDDLQKKAHEMGAYQRYEISGSDEHKRAHEMRAYERYEMPSHHGATLVHELSASYKYDEPDNHESRN